MPMQRNSMFLPFNPRRRGVALVIVLVAVGMAALVGWAMLSSATLQAQASSSAGKSASAEYLAESALWTGAFFLQNPSKAPAAWLTTSGHTFYVTGAALAGVDGSFDLDVTPTGTTDVYQVRAVGRSGGSPAITRNAEAQVKVSRVKPSMAGGFGGPITIGTRNTFNGPVVANGSVSNLGTVNGSTRQAVTSSDYIIPTLATVNFYGAGTPAVTYTLPDGTTGTPQALAAAINSFPAALASNPGRVYYRDGDLTISVAAAMSLSGTLIVKGNLTIQGSNTLTVNPLAQMPAAIVKNQVRMNLTNVKTVLNGVLWTGGGTQWTGGINTSSALTVNGAVLMPMGANPMGTLTGTATFNYVPAAVDVPGISGDLQPASSVTFLDWQQ